MNILGEDVFGPVDWAMESFEGVRVHRGSPFMDDVYGHAMTRIGDTLLFFAGTWPRGERRCPHDVIYARPAALVDSSNEIWLAFETTGVEPAPSSGSSLVCCNGKLILFGGFVSRHDQFDSEAWTNRLYTLSLEDWTWSEQPRVGPWPTARDKMCSFVFRDEAFFFGGYGYIRLSSSPGIEELEVDSDSVLRDIGARNQQWNNQLIAWNGFSWRVVKTGGHKPSPRAAAASCQKGHEVFVFGGRHGDTRLNDLYSFDVLQCMWTTLVINPDSPLPRGRSFTSLDLVCGMDGRPARLFVWGGLLGYRDDNSDPHAPREITDGEVWRFDLNEKKWTLMIGNFGSVCWHQTAIVDGRLTSYGGKRKRRRSDSELESPERTSSLGVLRVAPPNLSLTCLRAITKHGHPPKHIHGINELPRALQRATLWGLALNGSARAQKWAKKNVTKRAVFNLNSVP